MLFQSLPLDSIVVLGRLIRITMMSASYLVQRLAGHSLTRGHLRRLQVGLLGSIAFAQATVLHVHQLIPDQIFLREGLNLRQLNRLNAY